MVKLTSEMKEVFSQQKIFAAATASKNAVPNVATVATVQAHIRRHNLDWG